MAGNFLAGQSSVWVQPDGPNTEPKYLGCHSIGDVTEPVGDVTLLYCPDPGDVNSYKVKNRFRGEPGASTFSIETDLRKVADYLEELGRCAVPIYVHKVFTGRRDTFLNFDRTFVFYPATITSKSLGTLVSKTPGDENESTQGFDFSADVIYRGFPLQAYRVSVVETEDVTGIAVCGENRCQDAATQPQKLTDYIFLSTKALSGSADNKADVLKSIKGAAFTATSADPFAGGEDIQGIVCFRTGADTIRILVARGTTDAGNPAEIAYSDDEGATWTLVNVGSTNGEFVANSHALVALDRFHIWLGTSDGRIYFSSDGGATWTLQEAAVISATDITGISFVDSDNGYAVYTGGEVAVTVDGSADGATWSAVTVSGVTGSLDIHAIDINNVWVVGTGGKKYTKDAGVTWSVRDLVATATIDFFGDLIGLAAGSASSGLIWNTVDGGYDWQALPTIANTGFLDVFVVTPSLAYVVGKAQGGTGFVAKLLPQP